MEINTSYVVVDDLKPFNERLADLTGKGYNHKFRRGPDSIYCIELDQRIMPNQFNVDESWFFEDISEPDVDRMLYAITTLTGMKGVLADSYGVYSDNMSLAMIEKLERKERIIRTGENNLTIRQSNNSTIKLSRHEKL